MNEAQKLLIDKTLGWIGWIGIAATTGLLALGLFSVATKPGYKLASFVGDVFSVDEAALIFWPPLAIGIVLLWIRAFIRAGKSR